MSATDCSTTTCPAVSGPRRSPTDSKQVAPGVRLIVTPASQQVYRDAMRLHYLQDIADAGAVVTNATCGACFGHHMGLLGPGEVCITSSTRNFTGRMGSTEAEIYMASPATVAASAIAGHISDAQQEASR
jgi:3-isopropylmalate/(R)-2-methylmalate dehydratase large subunit